MKTDHLSTALCSILESPEHHNKGKFPTFFFPQLARLVKLSTVEELLVALAVAKSGKDDVASCARTFAKGKLADVLAQCDPSLPPHTLQQILVVVLDGGAAALGISSEQCDAYIRTLAQRLRTLQPPSPAAEVLLPLLSIEPPEISAEEFSRGATTPEMRAAVRIAAEPVGLAGLLRESGCVVSLFVHACLFC